MANPTTNFGWVMPNSADLVTDLPADFAVFGQGVDTSMAYLLGGTTGQILSKTSGTNMAFTWIANDQGDITGVTASTGLSGGGTSGTVSLAIDATVATLTGSQTLTNKTLTAPVVSTISNTGTLTLPTSTDTLVGRATTDTLTNKTLTSPALTTPTISTLTTNGDLVYGTGSGALARLGIGSTSTILTVAGGVPTWAAAASGGFTLIQDQQASSSSSINFTSIAGTFKHLLLTWEGLKSTTDSSTAYDVRLNADSTSIYHSRGISYIGTSGTVQAASNSSVGYGKLIGQGFQGAGVNDQSRGYLWIYDYASTTRFKLCVGSSSYMDQGLGETNLPMVLTNYASVSAITSVDLTRLAGSGNLTNVTSSSIRLYGVS